MNTMTKPACGCGCSETRGLERVRYFPRQLLAADDMRAEQEYFRQRQRRFNRFMMGWGVVCGLEVQADLKDPNVLIVCPGYALGPWGDEIYLSEKVRFDLARCLVTASDECVPRVAASSDQAKIPVTAYLAIKYAECPARPVRTTPIDCGCDDIGCDYTRIRDSFALECLAELPASHQRPGGATALLPSCPPCAGEPWLLLATVTIRPAAATNSSRTVTIDCISDRRMLAGAGIANTSFITAPIAQGDRMHPGEVLWPGQSISSTDGVYTFTYQRDGNLVLYKGAGTTDPKWGSNTYGTPPGVCVMQSDGNLVLYDPTLKARWNPGTFGHPGSRLIVQTDGNVVIYQPDDTAIWDRVNNPVQPIP